MTDTEQTNSPENSLSEKLQLLDVYRWLVRATIYTLYWFVALPIALCITGAVVFIIVSVTFHYTTLIGWLTDSQLTAIQAAALGFKDAAIGAATSASAIILYLYRRERARKHGDSD